jgi:hypothetical protein
MRKSAHRESVAEIQAAIEENKKLDLPRDLRPHPHFHLGIGRPPALLKQMAKTDKSVDSFSGTLAGGLVEDAYLGP